MMFSIPILLSAALFEILGCWYMMQGIKSGDQLQLVFSLAFLALFSFLVSLVDLGFSGRTYAAYGGIYIAAAAVWFVVVDQGKITTTDVIGVVLAVIGSVTIIVGAMK